MFLYHLHDWQQACMMPVRLAAEAAQSLCRNPLVPVSYTPAANIIAASAEMIGRIHWPYKKPEFGITSVKLRGQQIKVEEEIVCERPFCRLLHFKRKTENLRVAEIISHDPKVLIIAPLAGHHATLLRNTVQAMLPEHDVYITDWRDAKMVPLSEGTFDLDDNIEYIKDFITTLGPNLHVIAVCQPSVPALCAVSIMAEENNLSQPRSLTLMGGPIDARAAPTLVSEFAAAHSIDWYENTVIHAVPFYYPGAYRFVFPGFLQLQGFICMHPVRHTNEQFKMFLHLVRGDDEAADYHKKFYDEFLATMDVTAEYYLQTIEKVFHNYDLPKGTFTWRGHKVRPEAITKTALLVIEGEMDDISAPGQTRAALEICRGLPLSMKQYHLQISVGHFGVFSGRKWRNSIQPVVRDFIRRHDQQIRDY